MILGPMFSGKSTRLIQHIRTFKTLEYDIFCIKPDIDTRYTIKNEICTHNMDTEACHLIPVDGFGSISSMSEFRTAKIIIIEEAQFFKGLYENIMYWMDTCGKQIYLSALNGDSNRGLFGEIYTLLPLCHSIEWMTALCKSCKDGTPGVYSKRKQIDSTDQVHVASSDVYEAVCHKHYLY